MTGIEELKTGTNLERVLRQLADDEGKVYPLAAGGLQKFYMDDYLSSFLDETEAVSTLTQCASLLSSGGFQLTKSASNTQAVLQAITKPDNVTEGNVQWNEQENTYMKVLGIEWCPTEDTFKFKVNMMEDMVCTKGGMSWLLGKVVEVCPGKDGIQPVRTTLLS
ncbi:hypothetical protein M8J77_004391 [Diaphorina citri]|nr:hypothetical protein M8J77_004391 [Diaphorina citri]